MRNTTKQILLLLILISGLFITQMLNAQAEGKSSSSELSTQNESRGGEPQRDLCSAKKTDCWYEHASKSSCLERTPAPYANHPNFSRQCIRWSKRQITREYTTCVEKIRGC